MLLRMGTASGLYHVVGVGMCFSCLVFMTVVLHEIGFDEQGFVLCHFGCSSGHIALE